MGNGARQQFGDKLMPNYAYNRGALHDGLDAVWSVLNGLERKHKMSEADMAKALDQVIVAARQGLDFGRDTPTKAMRNADES